MIKRDLINEVVEKTGVTKTQAEKAVENVFQSLKQALGRGERIELRRFGVFLVRPRKSGIARNLNTGEQVSLATGKAVKFKPGKDLKLID